MSTSPVNRRQVFLNIPYDASFEALYVAYIVGVVELGLKPVATLAIPGGQARLDRIFDLMRASRYSIHDLSRVELDRTPPRTPRFNMPFELGMAVAWAKVSPTSHTYIAFEAVQRRAQKSLSDMPGSDFNIHDNSPEGVMRELCSAFSRQGPRPTVPDMMRSYATVRAAIPEIMKSNGAKSIFEGRMFDDLVLLARAVRLNDTLRSRGLTA